MKSNYEDRMLNEIEELERLAMAELNDYDDCIVSMPKSKKEYIDRFSLLNSEISINKIEFRDIVDSDLYLIVEPPKTKQEFCDRFCG